MSSYRFGVDFDSLMTAAQGVADTVKLLKDKDVEDFVPSEEMLGSDEVWSAVKEFKDRWEVGLNHLKSDVESMAGILGEVAGNYVELDKAGGKLMKSAISAAKGLATGGTGGPRA